MPALSGSGRVAQASISLARSGSVLRGFCAQLLSLLLLFRVQGLEVLEGRGARRLAIYAANGLEVLGNTLVGDAAYSQSGQRVHR